MCVYFSVLYSDAHILNGCHHYIGLCTARLVDLVARDLGKINQGHDCKTFKHSAVQINWFYHNVPDYDYVDYND